MRKIDLWFVETTKCCNLFALRFEYPSCVEVIVEEFEFVVIPLSVEVIVGVLALCLSL